MEIAGKLQIPLTEDHVTIRKGTTRSISTAYTDRIEIVPTYFYPWEFAMQADALTTGPPLRSKKFCQALGSPRSTPPPTSRFVRAPLARSHGDISRWHAEGFGKEGDEGVVAALSTGAAASRTAVPDPAIS